MIKSYSDILDDLFGEVGEKTPLTNFNRSAVLRHILEAIAKVIADLYGLLKQVVAQSYVTTATGNWLDLKVQEIGLTRKSAVKTQMLLTFFTDGPAGQNITIPQGTICKSVKDSKGNDYRFITAEEAILLEGESSVSIVAEAEDVGSDYNLPEETITRMVTRINGIASVTNIDTDGSKCLVREGSDGESDESLRQRAITTWSTIGIGGTRDAYKAWASSVAGVKAVSILDDFPYGPGTVGVVILGENGTPSVQLMKDVQDYINDRKPLTADVRISGPSIVEHDVTLTITRFANTDKAEVETKVLQAVADFSSNLQLGEGLIRARLVHELMKVDGVYNCQVNIPEEDIPASPEQFIEISNVVINPHIKDRTYQDSSIAGTGGNLALDNQDIPTVNKQNFEMN